MSTALSARLSVSWPSDGETAVGAEAAGDDARAAAAAYETGAWESSSPGLGASVEPGARVSDEATAGTDG